MDGTDHATEPAISLLPSPLTLLRLGKSDLDICTKHLLRLAFFNQGSSSFFSYTETEEEASLILDEESKKLFLPVIEELQLPHKQWRAIEIFEGPQALDQTGYIARFSAPLARHRVDLIYLSTYHTDLILVMEEDLERAKTSLQSVAHSSGKSSPTRGFEAVNPPKFVMADNIESLQGDDTDAHILAQLTSPLHLVNFSSDVLPSLSHSLLKTFLLPESTDRFFSYTCYGGQVTLIIDDKELESLRPQLQNLNHHEHLWNALHLQASPEGIDSSVVNHAANVLAQSNIPIYYLSTLNDDFILVPQKSAPLALQSLQGLSDSSAEPASS